MYRLKIPLSVVLVLGFISSCRKDVPPTLAPQGNINISTSKRLLICNEGNFGQNNATLSEYDPLSNSVIQSAYAASNANQSLGDVLESIAKFNKKYYLLINNSGTIVVCDNNFVRQTTISGLISPRYIEFVSENEAYISNLQLNSTLPNYIQVLDLITNTITKTVRLDGWSEQMEQSHGEVFITNQSKNYVYVIDTRTDMVMDSINIRSTSACIVKDENEKLWVSCNADATHNIQARLVEINPVTHKIEDSLSLQTTQNSISRLCINGSGTSLYYLMNDVFKMSINATNCPSIPVILQGTHNFYGLCIDPDDETIYVSDATDYNSFGKLLRYQQSNFGLIGNYTMGVTPGFMMVDEQ
jgi:YVTN family beta-propeller protein